MNVTLIGGGVIGLSVAYELASRNHCVTLLEKSRLGQKASWAGAGVLPPSCAETAIHPMEHLEARSTALHRSWSQRLLQRTGLDNGFRDCGGVYLARTAGEKASLAALASEWSVRRIEINRISPKQWTNDFAALGRYAHESDAWFAPGESQFCNPHHTAALAAACRMLGVQIIESCGDIRLQRESQSSHRVKFLAPEDQWPVNPARLPDADAFCITAGAWSNSVMGGSASTDENVEEENGTDTPPMLPMVPVRGQMLMYKLDESPFAAVINEGSRYLVPRSDGHILFGATIEETGFDESTTQEGIENLKAHAARLLPMLTEDRLVRSWAGLRPGTFDGFPYIGPLADTGNVFVATGHFKAGLHLATGTAEIVADLMEQKTPAIDIRPFSPSRVRMTA